MQGISQGKKLSVKIVTPATIPCPGVHGDYKYTFKMFGKSIVRYSNDEPKKTVQFLNEDVFKPTLVQVSEHKCYLIGGSTDIMGQIKAKCVFSYDSRKDISQKIEKKSDISTAKNCIGVCLSQDKKRIYTVGGGFGPKT